MSPEQAKHHHRPQGTLLDITSAVAGQATPYLVPTILTGMQEQAFMETAQKNAALLALDPGKIVFLEPIIKTMETVKDRLNLFNPLEVITGAGLLAVYLTSLLRNGSLGHLDRHENGTVRFLNAGVEFLKCMALQLSPHLAAEIMLQGKNVNIINGGLIALGIFSLTEASARFIGNYLDKWNNPEYRQQVIRQAKTNEQTKLVREEVTKIIPYLEKLEDGPLAKQAYELGKNQRAKRRRFL